MQKFSKHLFQVAKKQVMRKENKSSDVIQVNFVPLFSQNVKNGNKSELIPVNRIFTKKPFSNRKICLRQKQRIIR